MNSMFDATMQFIFVLANLAIMGGYMFIAFAIVPRIQVQLKRTKIGGGMFFFLCGMTHFDQAIHGLLYPETPYGHVAQSWHMQLIHIPQAIAVWLFVVGLYIELVQWGPWRSLGPPDDDVPATPKGADSVDTA